MDTGPQVMFKYSGSVTAPSLCSLSPQLAFPPPSPPISLFLIHGRFQVSSQNPALNVRTTATRVSAYRTRSDSLPRPTTESRIPSAGLSIPKYGPEHLLHSHAHVSANGSPSSGHNACIPTARADHDHDHDPPTNWSVSSSTTNLHARGQRNVPGVATRSFRLLPVRNLLPGNCLAVKM